MMTGPKTAVATFMLCLLVAPEDLASQPARIDCDAFALHPIEGISGYGPRQHDPRCEGIYQSPVSGSGLEVVSLTLGPVAFDLASDDRLVISVPDSVVHESEIVHVRAVALLPRTYYRMDALLEPGGELRWPTDTVLRSWNLGRGRIGVHGWVEHAGGRVLVPVVVEPEQALSADRRDVVLAKLRSAAAIDRLVWREVAADGSVSEWRSLADRVIRGGVPVTFEVPLGPVGDLHYELRARRARSDRWFSLEFRMRRPAA